MVIVVTQIVLCSLSVMYFVPSRLEAEPQPVCEKLAFLLKTPAIL